MRDKSTSRVLLIASNLFLCLGMIAAVGPALPELARNNSSSLSATGAIFTAIFLGSVPAELISGWLNDKYGPRPVLAAGMLILSIGLAGGLLSHNLPLTLAFMTFGGFGDGALVVGANVMVAQTFAKRSASALNLLNVFYGVGAIVGPALVGASLGLWHTALPPLWLISVLLLLLILAVPSLGARKAPDAQAEPKQTPSTIQSTFYLSPFLWLLGILLLLYVGVEVGTGGWVATYMQRTTNIPAESAAFTASAFYLSLTTGRLVAAGLGTKVRSGYLLLASLLIALLGGLGMLLTVSNPVFTIASIVILGASFGPIYPTIVSVVAGRFPQAAGRASSLIMAIGSVGGTIIPWLQGNLIEGFGAPSLALSTAAIALGMLALFAASYLVTRPRSPVPTAPATSYTI